jgi:hypothetical protein
MTKVNARVFSWSPGESEHHRARELCHCLHLRRRWPSSVVFLVQLSGILKSWGAPRANIVVSLVSTGTLWPERRHAGVLYFVEPPWPRSRVLRACVRSTNPLGAFVWVCWVHRCPSRRRWPHHWPPPLCQSVARPRWSRAVALWPSIRPINHSVVFVKPRGRCMSSLGRRSHRRWSLLSRQSFAMPPWPLACGLHCPRWSISATSVCTWARRVFRGWSRRRWGRRRWGNRRSMAPEPRSMREPCLLTRGPVYQWRWLGGGWVRKRMLINHENWLIHN